MEETLQYFIDQIACQQSKGNKYFPEGLFPAFRSNRIIGYKRPDTTIFFSAVICFSLQSIRKTVSTPLQRQIDSICEAIIKNYPDFQNKDGLKTYNFWKTKPSRHFSNGFLFRHFDHFRIPDDVDDTAFVYLTTSPSEEELHWLKNKLSQHANGSRQWIRNTYPEYRHLNAYSTWFGKNMYVEFDVSVLCNLLFVILNYNLPLNEHDDASLEYIRSVIATNRYQTQPFRCAHQYPATVLIIYHVARLLATFEPTPLKEIKEKLIADTEKLLKTATNPMEKVILASSLMRFGIATERILVEKYASGDFRGFHFFIAGLLTAYENPVLYRLSSSSLFHLQWTCEAHCWTLLAEYESLRIGIEEGSKA